MSTGKHILEKLPDGQPLTAWPWWWRCNTPLKCQ